ncbi:MAG: hypothetical protein LUE19_01630 [Clostridiales bacterium]|nr:hypothetical protein [Clostridiales bacterium]
MSKKLTKRLLSLVLTLSMMCSLAVTPALAADGLSDTAASGTVTASDSEGPEYIEAGNLIAEDEGCVEIVETDPATESGQGNSADSGVAAASDGTETDDADSSVISVSDADSFAEAVSTANASESAVTIQLTDDVALDTSAIFSGTAAVTLDLAGHAITRGSSTTGYLIGIGSGSNLTVMDSVGGGYIDGATYTVNGTTYVGYSILTNGTLALNSGTLKGYYGLYISGSDANVTISGSGAVEGTSRGISMNSGTLTVEAGTITGGTYGMVQFTGETTINGGTIGSAGEGRGIQHQGGNLTINDGTVLGEYAVTSNAYNANTTLTVTGGIIGNTSASTDDDDLSSMALVGMFVISSTTTYDAAVYISGGTITAYDSGVYIQGNVAAGETSEKDSYNATVTVSDDAVIETVYNSTYGYSDSGVSVWGKGAVLNVEGGTIKAGVFAIAGNGTYNTSGSGYSHAGTVINISDGKISSAGTAIYHPQDGTINISGGTISGYTAGIEIRAGKLTVTDGSIESTFTPLAYLANGSGTTVLGAALAVSQHTTKLPITVNISGGSFKGFYGVFESNVQENEYDEDDLYSQYEDYITVNISGGEFYTTWGEETINELNETEGVTIEMYGEPVSGTSTDTMVITGGYYNAEPCMELAEGYCLAVSTTNTYPYYVTDNRIVAAGMDLASGVIEVNVYIRSDASDIDSLESVVIDSKEKESVESNVTVDDYICDVFTQKVNATQMVDDLIITLELTDDYYVTLTTSVRELANTWLTENYPDGLDLTDSKVRVVVAMLNYGASTQLLANSELDDCELANYGYAYDTDSTVSGITDSAGTAYSGITYTYLAQTYKWRLPVSTSEYSGPKLTGGINISYYSDFAVQITFDSDISSYYGTSQMTVNVGDIDSCEISASGSYLIISGLSAADLAETITITMTDSESNTVVYQSTISGLYGARKYIELGTEYQKLFGKNLYMYSNAVKALSGEGGAEMRVIFDDPEISAVYLSDNDDVTTDLSNPDNGGSAGEIGGGGTPDD